MNPFYIVVYIEIGIINSIYNYEIIEKSHISH